MGLLQGLSGNMQEVTQDEAHSLYQVWLIPGETIKAAYRLLRDGFCITTHRLIFMDRQGATGKKTRIHSIPIDSIVDVTAETAGAGFDDSEITITYITTPNKKSFNVQLASYTVEFPRNFDVASLYAYFMSVAVYNVEELNK